MTNTTEKNIQIPPEGKAIIDTILAAGFEAYTVGGCVRDWQLGTQPHDWDICTNSKPKEVEAIFEAAANSEQQYKIIETGIKHGTVTVVLNSQPFEITTYREDGPYSDGRHPDSIRMISSLNNDLARRDFTINAMAYNENDGLVDPYGGKADLDSRLIRCVGDPDTRFQEDGLRILRALRFASTLGFVIEPNTSDSIFRNKRLLRGISAERIQSELTKILTGRDAGRILAQYRDVIAEIIPELTPMFGFEQHSPWHCYDVWGHTVVAISNSPPDPIVRIALLFHDSGKPTSFTMDESGTGHFRGHPDISKEIAETVLRRLRFDNETITAVTLLVERHDSFPSQSTAGIRRLLSEIGENRMSQLLAIRTADIMAQSGKNREHELATVEHIANVAADIIKTDNCLKVSDLAINGTDLISEGIAEGPPIGQCLRASLELVLENPACNTREILLTYCKLIAAESAKKE